jgi:PadR family transcriptional regulator PadR
MKKRDDTPLGTFEEQVMLAVIRTSPDSFGMAVRRELEEVTGRTIAVGAVYATLDRLEAKRLVSSRRKMVGGVSRRVVAVTQAGIAALAESNAMREHLWRGVQLPGQPSPAIG